MPKLSVEGHGEFEVEAGKRLVLALEEDAKVDQLHACGGLAKCTTCRVEVTDGEPSKMTQAELDCLSARELIDQPGLRLSCQVPCDSDMSVKVISRLAGSGRLDAGGPVDPELKPEPVAWVEKPSS
ncbi:MAG: 2Fe-2S iron-sulfur cluster-binding protein [Pirellulaceae bacterium]